MRGSGSSGPLHVHLVPSDPLVAERIRIRVAQRPLWEMSVGLSCRIPPGTDVVLLPADRCADCLLTTAPDTPTPILDDPSPPAYLAYGAAELLVGCVLRGCTDYLKTPWDGDELEFRLERFARPLEFSMAGVQVRLERLRLVSEVGRTEVTAAERALLELLIRHSGETVSRDALFYALWGTEGGSSRLVDVYVSRLRRRLREVLPSESLVDPLRSVRGRGYTLEV